MTVWYYGPKSSYLFSFLCVNRDLMCPQHGLALRAQCLHIDFSVVPITCDYLYYMLHFPCVLVLWLFYRNAYQVFFFIFECQILRKDMQELKVLYELRQSRIVKIHDYECEWLDRLINKVQRQWKTVKNICSIQDKCWVSLTYIKHFQNSKKSIDIFTETLSKTKTDDLQRKK